MLAAGAVALHLAAASLAPALRLEAIPVAAAYAAAARDATRPGDGGSSWSRDLLLSVTGIAVGDVVGYIGLRATGGFRRPQIVGDVGNSDGSFFPTPGQVGLWLGLLIAPPALGAFVSWVGPGDAPTRSAVAGAALVGGAVHLALLLVAGALVQDSPLALVFMALQVPLVALSQAYALGRWTRNAPAPSAEGARPLVEPVAPSRPLIGTTLLALAFE